LKLCNPISFFKGIGLSGKTQSITRQKYYNFKKQLIVLIEKKKERQGAVAGKLGLIERMIYNVLDGLRLTLEKINVASKEKNFSKNQFLTVRKLQ
jgi:hypothetical protein